MAIKLRIPIITMNNFSFYNIHNSFNNHDIYNNHYS